VGNNFRDQLLYAGHYSREDDIDQLASLGIKKLRYPVLWEKHEPEEGKRINWSWTEKQLNKIRSSGIEPIAGLLHHGSGPAFTDLPDEDFPAKLAAYAGKVAAKFPWINYYTPVNEPLTTARFSGLYGFWYPHLKDEASFFRMLINEVKGTILSMQAIREHNPQAVLVQTEDLAKIHSTPLLKYQADFENRRRWLTYDLLCGLVNKEHFFWNYLAELGIPVEELEFIRSNPCPPGIMGFNYYVTSERYLDENLEAYPEQTHGGNGIHFYADTEAVRAGKLAGLEQLLMEAWDRYGLPLAITECHLSCSREEQLRWFSQHWEACCRLCKEGIDLKAMTAWSLLGAYDWNSVLTKEVLHYDPGAFDICEHKIRPTSLTRQIRAYASGQEYNHPLLSQPGWWNRHQAENIQIISPVQQQLVIIGKTGTLGSAFIRTCERRSIPHIALGRNEIDILDEESVRSVIDQYKPWAIINATGYVRVDDAETDCAKCFAVNASAPGILAAACNRAGIRFMTFSSDLVFDGNKKLPYYEAD
jgi:dTDP-4-dehydrorhamnose reductase